eukprot:TRINITY_DN6402_c0_g1_i8.p3 TRINITY_DN6402_c0_g1~~TRINITY_DN6402_c0_g1_i8.p3  ORF type:complete len:212 (-),score=-11.07 TRINITY_DN6402_c0_g1_i8:1209-1844(-)
MWIFFKVFYFVIRDSQEDFGGSKFLYKNYARQCRKSFYVAVRVSIQFRVLHSLSVAYLVNPISIVCQDNQGRPQGGGRGVRYYGNLVLRLQNYQLKFLQPCNPRQFIRALLLVTLLFEPVVSVSYSQIFKQKLSGKNYQQDWIIEFVTFCLRYRIYSFQTQENFPFPLHSQVDWIIRCVLSDGNAKLQESNMIRLRSIRKHHIFSRIQHLV